ncbi:MAG: AbrB/MazE/SpoVT family DNA-binding domain-containing protein [Nitrososphaerales archaeon]
MVKIQKNKAYTYKADDGKKIDHYKYLVTIPESAMAALGWEEGQELKPVVRRDTLVLQPATQVTEGSKTSDAES